MEKEILHLTKNWDEVKDRIKEQNIELTDEDLVFESGKEKEMLEKLQSKLHKSPEEIRAWIESLSANEAQAG